MFNTNSFSNLSRTFCGVLESSLGLICTVREWLAHECLRCGDCDWGRGFISFHFCHFLQKQKKKRGPKGHRLDFWNRLLLRSGNLFSGLCGPLALWCPFKVRRRLWELISIWGHVERDPKSWTDIYDVCPAFERVGDCMESSLSTFAPIYSFSYSGSARIHGCHKKL